MLDLKKMVANLEEYKIKLKNKKFELDEQYFVDLYETILSTKKECEKLQEQRNKGSQEIGKLMRDGEKQKAEEIKAEMTVLTEKVKVLENQVREKEEELRKYMLYMIFLVRKILQKLLLIMEKNLKWILSQKNIMN